MTSLSRLVTLSDLRQQADDAEPFSDIVIEASGISDPTGIRRTFQDAEVYGMPLTDRVKLKNMVTVVDTTTFLDHVARPALVSEEETPDLFYRSEEERERKEEKEREWMDSLSPGLKEAIEAGRDKYFPTTATSQTSSVSQLCISQVEISDVVILNKCDLQTEEVRVEDI